MSHSSSSHALALADYRRRVTELYADVRRAGEYPERAWQHWVHTRNELFRSHPQSALDAGQKKCFQGLAYYPYQSELRLSVAVEPLEAAPREVLLEQDGMMSMQPVGRLLFQLSGQPVELTLFWISGYGGGLFLPFRDKTNGDTTYGGGRYLLDSIKGADLGTAGEQLVLDFNFAYNPSCVYSPRWSCPLAPPENWLPQRVEGGELDFKRLP